MRRYRININQISYASVTKLSAALDAGSITALKLTKALFERTKSLNDTCKAYIEMFEASALSKAKKLDKIARIGSLHGIPFGLKDLIDVKGRRTTAGSEVLKNNMAKDDAHVVETLENAGANLLGKLNLHEFAYGATGENKLYGTPINVFDHSRLAGGSSSGSAAAVAWGLLPFALGTDTGGSVRVPASLNGLVGLKPTYGKISMRGIIPYCWTLDHVGIIARTVEDAALVLDVVVQPDRKKSSPIKRHKIKFSEKLDSGHHLSGIRIGIPKGFFFENVDDEILKATHKVIKYLETKGGCLCDVTLPNMDHTRTVSLTIQMPEALSFHMPWLKDRSAAYSSDFLAGLALGQNILAEHYVKCKRMLTNYRDSVDQLFEDVDVIITPSTPIISPKLNCVNITTKGLTEPVGNALTRFTSFFNMTGHPAITIPSGLHSKGLPMGVQLIGRQFGELSLLKLGKLIEENQDFNIQKPSI